MRLQTSVMVSAEIRARIDAIAVRENRSRSWVAERALEAFATAQEASVETRQPQEAA
jgi:predicted transcriptional regulator